MKSIASNPVPLQAIQSGGFFDPFLLLSNVGSHFIMKNSALAELTSLTGQLEFLRGATKITITPPNVNGRGFALAPYRCSAGMCVWYREISSTDKIYQGQLVS